MKIFSTLEDLWQYCLYCPICKENSRKVMVSGNGFSSTYFNEISYEKSNNILNIFFSLNDNKSNINYIINLKTNRVENIKEINKLKLEHRAHFDSEPYFFIESDCTNCNLSFVYSDDFDLNLLCQNEKKSSFLLERESFTLFKNTVGYLVDIWHINSEMQIKKASKEVGIKQAEIIVTSGQEIKFPIIDLNYSDLNKLFDTIETLVTFS